LLGSKVKVEEASRPTLPATTDEPVDSPRATSSAMGTTKLAPPVGSKVGRPWTAWITAELPWSAASRAFLIWV